MPDQSLGDFIAKARQERGLSLRALAKRAGVAFSAIWKLEQSLTRPEPKTLEALATALKVPYETLDRLSRGLPDRHDVLPDGKLTPEEGRITLLATIDRIDVDPQAREYLRKTTNAFFDLLSD